MRRHWYISLIVLLAVIIGALIRQSPRMSDPVYAGKTLTRWLEGHVPNSSANPPYNSAGWEAADEAVQHCGTNAVPILLRMISSRDRPPPILQLQQWIERHTRVRFHYQYAYNQSEEAKYAFQILGTNAVSAVPRLISIYGDSPSLHCQDCVADALGKIGIAARPAVPYLLRNFTNTNGEVRFHALNGIMGIGGDPATVVPALASLLKDPNKDVRWNAAVALSTFGGQARPAVPALLEALSDSGITNAVETALWQIAPDKLNAALVVGDATPIIANGVVAENVGVEGGGSWLVIAGMRVPCVRDRLLRTLPSQLLLYRRDNTNPGKIHYLGRFELIDAPEPSANANILLKCVVTDRQIVLCAREVFTGVFFKIRRVGSDAERHITEF